MTLSPGLQIVIMAHIMASVPPQVTTISVSGLMVLPMAFPCFLAGASREFSASNVVEYFCDPSWAAFASASIISFGGSKSGRPEPFFDGAVFLQRSSDRRTGNSVCEGICDEDICPGTQRLPVRKRSYRSRKTNRPALFVDFSGITHFNKFRIKMFYRSSLIAEIQ